MPDNKDLNARLGIEIKQSDLNKAKKATKSIEDGFKDGAKAAKQMAKASSDASATLAGRIKKAGGAVRETTADVVDLRDELGLAEKAAESLGSQLSKKASGITSQQLGATGDVSGDIASRAAQTRGAFEFAGVGGENLSGALEATEAFADLGEVALKTGKDLGLSAVSMGAVGVAALVGVAAFKLYTDRLKKANEEIKKAAELNREYDKVLAEGQEAIAARVQQAQAIQELERKDLARNLETAAKFKDTNPLDFLDLLTTDQEETAKKLADANQEIIDSEQALIDKAVDDFGPGILTMAEALEESTLAAEEAAAALSIQASLAGDTLRFEQEAAERGVEATEARIAAIEKERLVVGAQLAVLRTANSENEEAQAQIAALETSLNTLSAESDAAANAITSGAAAMVDAAKAAEAAAKEAAREQEQAAKKAASDAKRAIEKRNNDAKRAAEKQRNDAIREAEKQSKQAAKFNEDQADLLEKVREDSKKNLREHNKALDDIRDKAAEAELDALFDQDFKALFQIEKGLKRDLEKQNEKFADERLLARQAAQKTLNDLNERFTAEIGMYRQVASATANIIGSITGQGGAAGGRGGNVNNNNISVFGSGNPAVTGQSVFGLLQRGGVL